MKDIISRDFLLETAGLYHAYRDPLSPITQMLDFIAAETHLLTQLACGSCVSAHSCPLTRCIPMTLGGDP